MQTRKLTGYCNRDSPSPCNILSCLFAYTVKKIVAATDAANPRTFKMICGAERKWCSCEASAKVRIKIPLQQQDPDEFSEIQRHASQGLPYASNNCTVLSEKNTFKHFYYTRNKFFKERFFFFFLKRLTKCWTSKGKSQTLTLNTAAVQVNIHMTSSINNSFREHISGFNPKM